jgi:hypothetical protein
MGFASTIVANSNKAVTVITTQTGTYDDYLQTFIASGGAGHSELGHYLRAYQHLALLSTIAIVEVAKRRLIINAAALIAKIVERSTKIAGNSIKTSC